MSTLAWILLFYAIGTAPLLVMVITGWYYRQGGPYERRQVARLTAARERTPQ